MRPRASGSAGVVNSGSLGRQADVVDVQRALGPGALDADRQRADAADVADLGQIDVPGLPAGSGQVRLVAVVGDFGVVDLDVQLAAVAGGAREVDREGLDAADGPVLGGSKVRLASEKAKAVLS